MKFDVVIIGGGLSGLTSGIRLAQEGKKCAIISSGQSALHFSSGSFDLLNHLPDGTAVSSPVKAIDKLADIAPMHPYSKLGSEKFGTYSSRVVSFLESAGIHVGGDSQKNHYRITPMGILKPTWLTLNEYATSPTVDKLPWKRAALFNVEGFLDFYPRFIMDEFSKSGLECEVHIFSFPALLLLRRNPSEMRAANITRVLDKETHFRELAEVLRNGSENSDVIFLPAFLGFSDSGLIKRLSEAVGKPVYVLPTVPPSVPGIRTQEQLHSCFLHHGGVFMMGDMVTRAEYDGDSIKAVYSYNHGDIPFRADEFILATGSYFSQGLIANRSEVYEPVFGLDVNYDKSRDKWYSPNLFDKQEYESFGVRTDASFRALKNGKSISNLYVSGAVLEGFNPIKEGCGSGVSLLTSLYIADNILSK